MIAPAGRKLGKYEILHKLGRGGMADVYLAADSELGQNVALKLIEHAADADTRDSIEAERRGAALQRQLAAIDPRVVRVYGFGDLDGFFYVAMEYIDGQDLAELMRGVPGTTSGGRLEAEFATDVAVDVAETLNHAHCFQTTIDGKEFHGIVHGDIKPKNIRVDSHGNVRVLDFGIAKALSLSRRLTRNEFGSVPYASPERLDTGEVSAASDLWSLAVMLYEMVTGLQPYHGETTERLERMIRSGIPPPPAPDPCPETLRRILMKAMAPDPAVRYATASDFASDLRAFRAGETVRISTADLDATRRTFRKLESIGDETRRTAHVEEDGTRRSGSGPAPVLAAKLKWRSTFGHFTRVVAVLALGSLLYGSWWVISEYLLWKHSQDLERQVETEQISNPEAIWARWVELSKGNPSSWLLHSSRKTVKQKFVAEADQVISTYRDSDSLPVYEKDWERARTMLARALAVDPDDSVRGKLRLVEGHIARINGGAHSSLAELNLAVDKFNAAQQLMPRSPDPELGLARVYVYGLKDIDRAYQAMQQAQKRGYQLRNREKLQLADGYRARADRVFWDSRNVRGLPQEKDQIQRAADDYNRALGLYQNVAPSGNANDGIVRVEKSLETVNFRLQQLDQVTQPEIGR
jgi:eukaryotic-like serine/threonine-protein kinase